MPASVKFKAAVGLKKRRLVRLSTFFNIEWKGHLWNSTT